MFANHEFKLPSFICVLVCLPLLVKAAVFPTNISLGSSLSAGASPSIFWSSPNKDFAFGFQEIQPGSFLLAIWLDAIPEKTITWSANGGRLAPKGSKVELTSEKGLVLIEPSGQQIWRAKLPDNAGEPGYGALTDTGNFVLSSSQAHDSVLWQSFDEPTDTVLPTQTLNLDSTLIARLSDKNYSSGRFMMQLGTDGNLGLYRTSYPLSNNKNTSYLFPSPDTPGYQVVFSQNGSLDLISQGGSIVANLIPSNGTDEGFYQRVTLDYDGVLRHYVHPKSPATIGWSTFFFMPKNICTLMLDMTGQAECGYNSYCSLGNDTRLYCSCLPGYSLLDPNDEMGGCSQSFTSQNCQESIQQQRNEFTFQVLQNVNWPNANNELSVAVTQDSCTQACLDDCHCAIAVFEDDGLCWKKNLPLSGGQNSTSVHSTTTFVKMKINSVLSSSPSSASDARKVRTKKTLRTAVAISLVSVFILSTLTTIIILKKRNQHEAYPDETGEANDMESCLEFRLSTIKTATNGFSASNKLGQGGFGAVYMGRLPNGQQVAVKRLTAHSVRREAEFKNEVRLVARLHHKNLIKLIGFCLAGTERILIYELGINGSLDRFLFDSVRRENLDWGIRRHIIDGIARGLVYLHEESQLRIIHRDLKAGNILLDENMNAKISDFGTARLFEKDLESASKVVGTYGYMSPEYLKHGKISTKIDVFSFGVLLLEIACGKRINASKNPRHVDHLLSKAWKWWTVGRPWELIDPVLPKASGCMSDMIQCIHIGLLCVQEDPTFRPSMSSVILMLEGSSQSLPPPQKPAYFMAIGDPDTNDHEAPVMMQDHSVQLSVSSSSSGQVPSFTINQVSITQLEGR